MEPAVTQLAEVFARTVANDRVSPCVCCKSGQIQP
jgi:hypothetical protein